MGSSNGDPRDTIVDLSAHMADLGVPAEDPSQPNIQMHPRMFAGRWANAAQIQSTEQEIVLDFIYMGPLGQQGQIISRVLFSHQFLQELTDALTGHAATRADAARERDTIAE